MIFTWSSQHNIYVYMCVCVCVCVCVFVRACVLFLFLCLFLNSDSKKRNLDDTICKKNIALTDIWEKKN